MQYDVNSCSFAGGALAALVAGTLLLVTVYATTWWLVFTRSYAFWAYVATYGFLGYAFTRLIFTTTWGAVPFRFGVPNYIFWPIVTGLLVSIAKTKLVEAFATGDQLGRVVRVLFLFEPQLLQQIAIDESFAVQAMIDKQLGRRRPAVDYTRLSSVKKAIKESVPDRLPREKKIVFLEDLKECETADEAMKHYMRLVGGRWFRFTFPQATGEPFWLTAFFARFRRKGPQKTAPRLEVSQPNLTVTPR